MPYQKGDRNAGLAYDLTVESALRSKQSIASAH